MRLRRPMVYGGRGGGSKVGLSSLLALGWGQVHSDGPWRKLDTPRWLFDNGAWEAYVHGKPFPAAQFQRRIDRCLLRGFTPDFIVMPDVVGNFEATLELSAEWHSRIPPAWPKYLALQQGADGCLVSEFASAHPVQGLFLGGDDDFKYTRGHFWAEFAHARDLNFHFARVGTPIKFELAMRVDADSVDSSRLSRSWRDFSACRRLWLGGTDSIHPRLFADLRKRRVSA